MLKSTKSKGKSIYREKVGCLISKSAFVFKLHHLTYKKYCIEFICSICSSRKISNPKEKENEKENEKEKERRKEEKRRKLKK